MVDEDPYQLPSIDESKWFVGGHLGSQIQSCNWQVGGRGRGGGGGAGRGRRLLDRAEPPRCPMPTWGPYLERTTHHPTHRIAHTCLPTHTRRPPAGGQRHHAGQLLPRAAPPAAPPVPQAAGDDGAQESAAPPGRQVAALRLLRVVDRQGDPGWVAPCLPPASCTRRAAPVPSTAPPLPTAPLLVPHPLYRARTAGNRFKRVIMDESSTDRSPDPPTQDSFKRIVFCSGKVRHGGGSCCWVLLLGATAAAAVRERCAVLRAGAACFWLAAALLTCTAPVPHCRTAAVLRAGSGAGQAGQAGRGGADPHRAARALPLRPCDA